MTVENLEINVKTNVSGSSAQTIKTLADALGQLQAKAAALTGLSNLSSLATAMQSISGTSIKASAFSGIAKGIENLRSALSTLSSEDVARLSELSVSLKSLNGVDLSGLGNASNVARAAKGLKQTEQGIRNVGEAARESKKHTSAFGASIMRIMKYRMIRAVIKEIGQAFSEGLKNAYLFSSSIVGEGHRFAEAMDTMNSKATQMKAQLGSAFISLLTAIEPIVKKIIELIIRAADAVSQLIAAFTGTTYLRAAAVTDSLVDDFQSGAKAAKEWKNQLLGFDVINRLNKDGTTGLSPTELFGGEETPIDPKWLELAEKINNFKFTVDDVLFDWSDLTGEQIAEKALAGLFGLTGAVVGFALGGVPGAIVGSILGVAFGIYIDDLLFHQTGEKKNEILSSLATALFGIAGGMLGFFVGGPAGAALGIIAGAGLGLMISSALFSRGKASTEGFYNTLFTVLGAISGGLFGFFIGGHAGGVIGMVVGAAIGMVIASALFDKNSSASKEKLAQTLIIALGMVAGALIGFAVLPTPVGAVLGAAIGVAISLLVVSTLFDDNGASFRDKILASLVVTLGAVAGMLIGFFVGGVAGAAIGATIGVAITLWAVDVAWDAKSKAKIEAERENVFDDYVKGKFENPSTGNIFSDYATGNMEDPFDWLKNIPGLASGGFVPSGDLFISRESGPELVGSIGGRTAVANNDQIVEAVSSGVYQAVSSAMGSGNKNISVHVYLDSREIKTGQQRLARATGR